MKRKFVRGVLLAATMGVILPFAENVAIPEGSAIVLAAEESTTVDGVTYKYYTNGSTCKIVGCEAASGPLNIPSELNGYTVTEIGNYAFSDETAFSGQLTIPETVTTIGEQAFARCTGFTGDLTIPKSVTKIGQLAFADCSGFDGNLTIYNTSIGDSAFSGCTGFTGDLTVNGGAIGFGAFRGCSGFTGKLTLGDKVTSIGSVAFRDCTGFSGNLIIPDSVSLIGWDAFKGCSGFSEITIGAKVSKIGSGAFYGCTGLSNITIANSVTSIGYEAFDQCTSLRDVYYKGTEEKWNAISIDSKNEPLTNATIHFESNNANSNSAKNLEWETVDGKSYWYENGVKQGTYDDPKGVKGDGTIRGREIYDPSTDGWYWLDSVYDGAKACGKEVWMPYIYQDEDKWDDATKHNLAYESDEGMGECVLNAISNKTGKWVRYDENGKMLKGWIKIEGKLATIYPDQAGNIYYYDNRTGLMAKGHVTIDGKPYYFDEITGVLK